MVLIDSAVELSEKLDGRRAGSGFIARCPAHEDTVRSLSIRAGDKRPIVFHCFAGCGFEDVLKALKQIHQIIIL